MIRSIVVFGLVFLPCLPATAGNWTVEVDMVQRAWFPGEPITAVLVFTNTSTENAVFESGSLFLDDNLTPCVDRLLGVVDTPPGTFPDDPSYTQTRLGSPPETVRTHEIVVSRACNLEMTDLESLLGLHKICHQFPDAEDRVCADFEVLRPAGTNAEAIRTFPGELRDVVTDASKVPDTLVTDYPTSVYAGYILVRQLSPLPGVGENPGDKVAQLTDPGFFDRFPTTRNRSKCAPSGARVAMREAVFKAAEQRRRFLDEYPGFHLRTKIEKQLGDLELVLGNYDRAYEAWRWVAAHGVENTAWAEGMVQAMEVQKLVEPDAQTDQ